jgi:hypothetical protein
MPTSRTRGLRAAKPRHRVDERAVHHRGHLVAAARDRRLGIGQGVASFDAHQLRVEVKVDAAADIHLQQRVGDAADAVVVLETLQT